MDVAAGTSCAIVCRCRRSVVVFFFSVMIDCRWLPSSSVLYYSARNFDLWNTSLFRCINILLGIVWRGFPRPVPNTILSSTYTCKVLEKISASYPLREIRSMVYMNVRAVYSTRTGHKSGAEMV